ncbi:hypothetical protein PNP85_13975 [Halobacterium salinarum]|uniref:hypothetical protein n=1 Tax=Halobacterium salinarum TaxID=2242 RepID=UPI0025577FB4|nr:hypothetical protein [Halobacterium salinarum]MDL0137669.1 hypothetical protein [Halobacterium salinarum]MDL0140611.1 hypothetical protein [Halobacterium salinarum]
MAEKTTVAFRIDESTKEEWEKAAKDPAYQSLSHLIRLSVQREIAGEESAPRTAEADTAQTDNSEVLESLSRIEKVTEEIEKEVKATAREQRAEELYDLEQVLLEVLPTAPETYQPGPKEPEPGSVGRKPRDIAGRIGADTSDVSDALEDLANKIGQVRSAQSYYWRAE